MSTGICSSSLLGGVLNGETLRSLKNARGRVANPCSGVAAILIGFAGILGFSALLTGGGNGDFGRAGTTGPIEAGMVSAPTCGMLLDRFDGADGEDCLEGEALCWETRSRTLPKALVSTLSGDLDCGRAKKDFGGEVGDSILTEGVS